MIDSGTNLRPLSTSSIDMLPLLLAATMAAARQLEQIPIRCTVVPLPAVNGVADRQLLGCGPDGADELLWHLDIADGALDGTATRVTRGRGAVVYVLDTGVESSHDEFRRDGGTNVIAGIDTVSEFAASPSPCSDDSATHPCTKVYAVPLVTHGTAVASIVAGRHTGVAPDASIIAVRTTPLPPQAIADATDAAVWLRALDEIIRNAFDPATPPFRTAVINMSSTPSFASRTDAGWLAFEAKMKRMIGGVDANGDADPNGKRFLFVAAAGNNYPPLSKKTRGQCSLQNEVLNLPAAAGADIDGLITVGGVDRRDGEWSGSCGGASVDILAPAESLLVASITGPDHYRGTYATDTGVFDMTSGTSYAAPYVSGLAARLLEQDPTLTPADIEWRLKLSASNVTTANASAFGRVAVLHETIAGPRRRAAH